MLTETKTKTKKRADRDGLYLRRKHWHFEYRDPETGQWRSKTTGKKSYNEARTVRADFLEALRKNYVPTNDRLRFADAADAYMRHREVSVSAGTVRLEKERLRALKRVLATISNPDVRLKDFNIGLVRKYQQVRRGDVSARTTNMETNLLRSILKYYGQWRLDGKYKPLPEAVSDIGRALTPEEELRLFDTAKSNAEWFVAYHASVLENETGMRGVEVRNLRLNDIDLNAAEIRIRTSKTASGLRPIPLTPDALASVKALYGRARGLGSSAPEHYVIPRFVTRKTDDGDGRAISVRRFDPNKPTTGWRTAWRKLTAEAGLKGLRGHDLRHNLITAHAESGTPQSVLEASVGHLSKRMSDHYKHISERALRKAADELARVRAAERAEARAKLAARPAA